MSLRRWGASVLAAVTLLAPLSAAPATAGSPGSAGGDTYTPEGIHKRSLKGLNPSAYERRYQSAKTYARATIAGYRVGDRLIWPALDDTANAAQTFGFIYKRFRLRAVSEHGELWTATGTDDVSTGLRFPEGDCRNDFPERIRITDKKVRYFMRQFEEVMYPLETEAFSTPPRRAGNPENASLRFIFKQILGVRIPRDYYQDKGAGKRIVILIDNVRDDNFYDTDNANTLSRIGGFFSGAFSEMTDRHIMTIDSHDWKARTKLNPPHAPSTDPCQNYPARPTLMEGTFAHEFQHLQEAYADPDGETNWINEGVSDWAQTLTGYASPGAPISDVHYDGHVQCFLGYLEQAGDFNPIPAEHCGAEQSLNLWGDQTDNEIEILADYGAAYTMMEFLVDRFGADSMTFLHNDDVDGFDSLAGLLTDEGSTDSALDTIHDWLLVVAVDALLDGGATLHGSTADLEVSTLNAQVDWLNDDSYMTPGAPPNGGDFVLARQNDQQFFTASDINKIDFDGGDVLPPAPVEWTVDPAGHAQGDAALYSGNGDNLDRAIVEEVSVPANNATLTFDTRYNTEPLYDYAFVQVSTNGGESWTSLANEHTTTDTDTGPPISDQLPGLNGVSGTSAEGDWVTETFDLSQYAGQTILLSFRYMTDGGVVLPGWWIDNVTVGGTVISDGNDLADWQTPTEINPVEVDAFTVQVVAWMNDGSEVRVGELPLSNDGSHTASLNGQAVTDLIGSTADNVGFIVTYDEPTESITDYAPYVLTVNNVDQPGGS